MSGLQQPIRLLVRLIVHESLSHNLQTAQGVERLSHEHLVKSEIEQQLESLHESLEVWRVGKSAGKTADGYKCVELDVFVESESSAREPRLTWHVKAAARREA